MPGEELKDSPRNPGKVGNEPRKGVWGEFEVLDARNRFSLSMYLFLSSLVSLSVPLSVSLLFFGGGTELGDLWRVAL